MLHQRAVAENRCRPFHPIKIHLMPHKILIAIDSFKGSLNSMEAARAIAEGILCARPEKEILLHPMADGGEGSLNALAGPMDGLFRRCATHDPLLRPREGGYIEAPGGVALIESAAIVGLPLLALEERNPLKTTSYGVGEVIAEALLGGARRLVIALGGSATNDGGMGLLRALGVRFLDENRQEITGGGEALSRIRQIDCSGILPEALKAEWLLATDVDSPLCGPSGASRLFAPQKGADEAMVEQLEQGMKHYATLLEQLCGRSVASLPGSGAAGGMAAAMMALLGAEAESGFDLIARLTGLEERIASADLVITGEGCIDRQTVHGKLPAGVARMAHRHHVACIALCGIHHPSPESDPLFSAIYPTRPATLPLEEAMQPETAKRLLRQTAKQIASRWP